MLKITLESKCVGWFRKGTNYSDNNICIRDQLSVSIIAASAISLLCGISNGCSHVWVIALLIKSKWNYPDSAHQGPVAQQVSSFSRISYP